MGFLSDLQEIEVENDDALKTLMASNNHPALALPEEGRIGYLRCQAVLARADGKYHDAEKRKFRDLLAALNLSEKDNIEQLAQVSEELLENSIAAVQDGQLSLVCLAEMYLMAQIDGSVHVKENQFTQKFADTFGICGDELTRLKKLAVAIYSGHNANAIVTRDWPLSGGQESDQAGKLHAWVAGIVGVNTGNIRVESEADGKEAVVEPEASTSETLKKEIVDSLKLEITSQLNKILSLAKKIEKNKGDTEKGVSVLNGMSKEIESEIHKVEDLRMTIAFVGTMKAGKSTTINSIVGWDVLPSRSGAMTTLPTLITHAPGIVEPLLHFRKNTPFSEAIRKIKNRFVNKADTDAIRGALYEGTLNRILCNNLSEIKESYKGSQEIKEFMLSINDISRICLDYQLENPLEEYSSILDFPEVEVEFAYLTDRGGQCAGRLSLIDTPGPNEAGQGHLKGIVKEQLAAASALVCVVDPCQADSEAQSELRSWLQQAQGKSGAPLYVLFNKMDQVSYNERKPELIESKALRLFPDVTDSAGNQISVKGKVYGISSRKALLGNMASRAIAVSSCLPEADWVEDFYQDAYGDSGCPDDTDVKRHISQSRLLWQKSAMQKPINEVIASSLIRAVPNCFGAAMRLVTGHATNLKNMATIRSRSFKVEVAKLETMVKGFEEGLAAVGRVEETAAKKKDEIVGKIKKSLSTNISNAKDEILGAFGVEVESARGDLDKRKDNSGRRSSFLGLIGSKKHDKREQILTEDSPIEFDDKKEAQDLLSRIMEPLTGKVRTTIDGAVKAIEKDLEESNRQLSETIQDEVLPIIGKINAELKKEFDISITCPETKLPTIELDLDIAANSLVKTETKTKTYYERRLWTLYLWEHEVRYEDTSYVVNPKKVRKTITDYIDSSAERSRDVLSEYINNSFEENIKLFLKKVREAVESVKQALKDAIEDKKTEKEDQKREAENIRIVEKDIDALMDRSKKTKAALADPQGVA